MVSLVLVKSNPAIGFAVSKKSLGCPLVPNPGFAVTVPAMSSPTDAGSPLGGVPPCHCAKLRKVHAVGAPAPAHVLSSDGARVATGNALPYDANRPSVRQYRFPWKF